MQKKLSNLFTLGLASVVLFMSSCSMVNSEFSKQKYTKFKVRHDENTMAVNKGQDHLQSNSNSAETNIPTTVDTKVSDAKIVNSVDPTITKSSHSTSAPSYHAITKNTKEEKMSSIITLSSFKKNYSELKIKGKTHRRPTDDLVLIILCLLLPPVAVYIKYGISKQFWWNIFWCIVALYLGGIIHALYVCFLSGGGSGSRGEKR